MEEDLKTQKETQNSRFKMLTFGQNSILRHHTFLCKCTMCLHCAYKVQIPTAKTLVLVFNFQCMHYQREQHFMRIILLCNMVAHKHNCLCLFVCLFVCFCCFTSHVNSYGHCGTVSSLNHTFSWAGLSKRLTSNLCTYFRL